MTTSRHLAAPLRSRRHWTSDRIISAGLAITACAGIVGVIGVRSIEDSAAAQQSAPANAGLPDPEVLSSTGLTEAQLDDYAAQLRAEAANLDAYRATLSKAAKAMGSTTAATRARERVAKTAPKPARKPAAKPAPQAQSNTKGS